ncbi:NUDIX hydrolase [Agrobacterium genomosp. 3]|jgi:8-oxo-dGTP pyrophosphatase MutT (NUDIX family)|nr:NUDIX hydrolase [Agrobacterium pusense]MCA1867936.1 NUDIX hydrolase [Agrobacterium tomkonis]MCA1878371.1 NUDIX hydrolase [Agrobacterium tumefaciens]MCA1893511.1 NUDIX hydrolase [Agrobacterium tomkonis]MDH0872568.1 NUDIX hydrolase [Agrobacterium pusense]
MESAKHLSSPVIEQAAALCCRISDEGVIEILLISSRDTGRWVLPKGFVEKKESTFKAAQREALEEAGIIGKVRKKPIGHYSYFKDGQRPLNVAVHLLKFERQTEDFRERTQRRQTWVAPLTASGLVDEPELRELLRSIELASPLASQDKSILKRIAALRNSSPSPQMNARLA